MHGREAPVQGLDLNYPKSSRLVILQLVRKEIHRLTLRRHHPAIPVHPPSAFTTNAGTLCCHRKTSPATQSAPFLRSSNFKTPTVAPPAFFRMKNRQPGGVILFHRPRKLRSFSYQSASPTSPRESTYSIGLPQPPGNIHERFRIPRDGGTVFCFNCTVKIPSPSL